MTEAEKEREWRKFIEDPDGDSNVGDATPSPEDVSIEDCAAVVRDNF
jgi:hypothetical protein